MAMTETEVVGQIREEYKYGFSNPDEAKDYFFKSGRGISHEIVEAIAEHKNEPAATRRRDGERCQQCGSTDKLEVHHIKPLAEGGEKYELSNLITLCRDCHVEVGRSGHPIVGQPLSHPKPVGGETHIRQSTARDNFGPDNDLQPLVG
jgi:HNH endonuclease